MADAEMKPAAEGAKPEGEKPKRGKPKDAMAPPKPKSPYQKFGGETREKLKLARPELITDLSAMGKAMAEEWQKVPEEWKANATKVYEAEMAIWKPKWLVYKQTPHYKQFYEIKTDWLDARSRKKLQKKMTTDAPKRARSGYMIYAGEIREGVMAEVKEKGLGMGDGARMIAEKWAALGEAEKAKFAEVSAQQKVTFDSAFLDYRKGDSYRNYMDAKAKMESKQGLSKNFRTRFDDAPKKPASSYALFRTEVLPGIVKENEDKKEGEKLAMGDITKKVSTMWAAVSEDAKVKYTKEAEKLKIQYLKNMQEFKTNEKYSKYLEDRAKIKAKENTMLRLRDLPKRPKSIFALFADEKKGDVEPGKGEGKGRDALKKLWNTQSEDKKKVYENREAELKAKWLADVQAYKDGETYKTFEVVAKKVREEFENEAMKITTMKFLKDSPQAPPKGAFAMFLNVKRKAADLPEGVKLSKEAKKEEVNKSKQEWLKLDKTAKADYETQRKEQLKSFADDCKKFMESDKWKAYVTEAKRLKIPIKSLLYHKKKVIKKYAKGEKIPPSSIELPEKPASFPQKPKNAQQSFFKDKRKEVKSEELPKAWKEIGAEEKKKYDDAAAEDMKNYEAEMKEFRESDEGKNYVKNTKIAVRRRRLLGAKNKYLDNLPVRPIGAIKKFQLDSLSRIRKENPGKKGFELKKLLTDAWTTMSDDERKAIEDAGKEREKKFQEDMAAFKASDDWKNFNKACKPPGGGAVKKVVKKGKGKGKGQLAGPPRPEMPKKPLGAFQMWAKENTGLGNLTKLAELWKNLEQEKKAPILEAAKEADKTYSEEVAVVKTTDAWKKYEKIKSIFEKRKRLTFAKSRFLTGMPKRPPTGYFIFVAEQRPKMATEFPDIKGLGPTGIKMGELWKGLTEEAKGAILEKEKVLTKEYDEKMAEFKATPDYKKYQAIEKGCLGKPKVKAKAKSAPVNLGPPKPENFPKKPPMAQHLYGAEMRKQGQSLGLKQLHDGWIKLGADGQKPYMEQVKEMSTKYDTDMKEFGKTADGKKYIREKAAHDRKCRVTAVKSKFLGKGDTAMKEPKRPPSAYFIFVGDKRSALQGSVGEVAKQLSTLWAGLEKEAKDGYEAKAKEAKDVYEKAMTEFKNSDSYKKYAKALGSVNGGDKKAKAEKARAKAKAAAEKKDKPAKGGGRGKGAGRGAKPGAAKKDDSDSDVMGSDSEDSSSDSSDSD